LDGSANELFAPPFDSVGVFTAAGSVDFHPVSSDDLPQRTLDVRDRRHN